MRFTESTKRALDRVKNGESPYSAAKAENISLSTIYNAQKKMREEGYDDKGGAPKSASKKEKTHTVANFSIKIEEMDLIDKASKSLNVSRAEFMRTACLEKAKNSI